MIWYDLTTAKNAFCTYKFKAEKSNLTYSKLTTYTYCIKVKELIIYYIILQSTLN